MTKLKALRPRVHGRSTLQVLRRRTTMGVSVIMEGTGLGEKAASMGDGHDLQAEIEGHGTSWTQQDACGMQGIGQIKGAAVTTFRASS